MEYQSLKKLKRMDLLEMLIAQVEENERLLEKMEQLHFQLERQKTLSPREVGACGSAASTQVSSRAMGRSQGFAGSAGYVGSAGLMGSAGSAAAMASRSSAVSSTSTCLTGSAGSLRSASGMQAQQGFAAGKQGSLSSAAPYAAGSSYQSASYASAAQSDPYAPASQVNSYAQASQLDPYDQTPSNASASRLDPYAPAAQAAPYTAVSQSDPYASESPYYAKASLASRQYEKIQNSPSDSRSFAASGASDAQPAHYAAERESGHMGHPNRPREELNYPDSLREEPYGHQPLSFGEIDGAGVLPSFLQEMPWEDREDFSRSRVQLSREAQAARPDAPRHQQNVVPLKPSQVGTRTENFAPASSAASVAAGAGTPAAARQGRFRPLHLETGSGYTASAADKVNRSHA